MIKIAEELAEIAQEFDSQGLHKEANQIVGIMEKLAQNTATIFPPTSPTARPPIWNQYNTPPKQGQPTETSWQVPAESKQKEQAELKQIEKEIKELMSTLQDWQKDAYYAAKAQNQGRAVSYPQDLYTWNKLNPAQKNDIARKIKQLETLTKRHYQLMGYNK